MAVGDIITALRYNNLQTTIENILGNGSGTEGYGQTTASNQVPVGKLVTNSDMNNLYNDFNKIYRHQVNSDPSASISTISVSNLIADDNNEPSSILKGYVDFENFGTVVSSDPNRFRLHTAQSSSDDEVVACTRTAQWRNELNAYVRVGFVSTDARRHFFNSGGTITFKANLTSSATGGNVDKTNNWVTMLSNSGNVSFGYNYTSSDNSGTGSAIGNYQLTNGQQQIYRKAGSGLYSSNNYYLFAKNISATMIEFRIRLVDSDSGSDPSGPNNAKGWVAVDEYVVGSLSHWTGYLRASGSFVDVAAPTITRQSNFSGS